MALLPILKFPDNRLRNKAKPVTEFDQPLQEFVDDLYETMYEDNGVGLAATQVNIAKRVLVLDTSVDQTEPLCFINPEITRREGEQMSPEGCLSVPGIYEEVKRASIIEVTAYNKNGEQFVTEADGLLSACIQHEIDHLDGILFIDHLSSLKRSRIVKKLKKIRCRNL